jgi:peptidoglycan/xylan/chitin deacetylase (PgdA/CDA1 family)
VTSGSVPILAYHRVGPPVPPHFKSVSPDAFAAQIGWLSAWGYVAVTLDALLAARRGGPPLPRGAVVLTFDDGYEDCLRYAVPALERHGYTAAFFLVAGLVGGRSIWHRRSRGSDLPLFDWAAARRLADAGFTCGAHSMTHPPLTKIGVDACRWELSESRSLLEERLERRVLHLAYPYGAYDDRVHRLTREAGYETACSTRSGRSPADDDLFALRRIHIPADAGELGFASRFWTGHGPADLARRVMRRVSPTPVYAAGRRIYRALRPS